MNDDVQPPATSLDAGSPPMDIVYEIVHTPKARPVMACLYRGEPVDTLRGADDGAAVDAAVGLLRSVGIVTGDPVSLVLTARGRRLHEQFAAANDSAQS